MTYPVEGFLKINENIIQIMLMLKVLFTQDSEVEDLCCGLLPALNPAINSSTRGLSLFKMTFSMALLEWLMRLMALLFWQSCKLPFLGSVIISD